MDGKSNSEGEESGRKKGRASEMEKERMEVRQVSGLNPAEVKESRRKKGRVSEMEKEWKGE